MAATACVGTAACVAALTAAAQTDLAVRQPPSSPAPPTFKVGVDVVPLAVTVSDPQGRYVTDLEQDQFTVFEDGIAQDIVFFTRTNQPIALSLLLDTSASMNDRLATAQEAAIGFARHLKPHDLAQLIDFDRDVKVLQPFTGDRSALEEAIRHTTAGGSTSLYNAIYIALKELKKVKVEREADVRREAIVVFSDGEDTSSLVSYESVLDLAKRSNTAVYTIGLRSKEELAERGFHEADFVLRSLAQQTGGRAFFPTRIEDLSGIYQQIADELASQYVIGYVSKNPKRDGAWRRLTVRVARESVAARTRQGYYGPSREGRRPGL